MLTNKLCVIACLNLLMTLQSVITENNCEERAKSLINLDVAEDLMTRAKLLLPNCPDVGKNTSKCGAKERLSVYLDMTKKLISEAKENYPTCIGPEIEEPEEPKEYPKSRDCTELLENGQNVSGVYTIWPNNSLLPDSPLKVFCDMETDGGGWTVVQRRGDFKPQEIFYRNWNAYKLGFGNLMREFWLGNDNLFVLSNQGKYKIQFDLESSDGEKAYAVYETFRVEHEENEYKLHIGNYKGTAGDSMSYHNEQPFSTKDRDNELSYITTGTSCASRYKSGWWFHQRGGSCAESDLNSVYKPGGTNRPFMRWKEWKTFSGLAATKIKIKAI